MSRVMHRNGHGNLPRAVRGADCYLFDSSGKRYLDASAGAAVSCLGHSHPAVIHAVREQIGRLAFAHTAFFTNEPMEALADLLIKDAPAGLSKVWFASSGSEAMEAALKLGRQYFLERGEPQRRYFIARRQSFHGNTLGALAVGGNAWRRAQFEPLLIQAHHIGPCYAYRDRRSDESEYAYGQRVANELETAIGRLGAGNVIAFVAEPVVGATLGAVPAVPGYFARVREICDRHGILLIFDEVMCGMGRTGTLHACEQEQVAPDIMTISKGLGAGYQPIGAMLVSGVIDDAIRAGSGFFQHGQTFVGHATACAGALAVLRTIGDLLAQVRSSAEYLQRGLFDRFADHPHIGDIRGRGLFRGIELVSDRSSRAPFDPQLKLHARIRSSALEQGLICYPMGGTIDGTQGDHVLLAPPFIISRDQIHELIDKLGAAIEHALQGIRT